jgi:hypothetical protein
MNLKEIRISNGFTQVQMVEKMFMEQTTYSKKKEAFRPSIQMNGNAYLKFWKFHGKICKEQCANCQLHPKRKTNTPPKSPKMFGTSRFNL